MGHRGTLFSVTEAQEQHTVVEWCRWKHVPCFHIPNGGYRNKHTAYQLKRQGVEAGVPDLCIPVPSKGYHGLFIEMKTRTGGRVSEHQKQWLELLNNNGYMAVVCHGATEAIATLESYL